MVQNTSTYPEASNCRLKQVRGVVVVPIGETLEFRCLPIHNGLLGSDVPADSFVLREITLLTVNGTIPDHLAARAPG